METCEDMMLRLAALDSEASKVNIALVDYLEEEELTQNSEEHSARWKVVANNILMNAF